MDPIVSWAAVLVPVFLGFLGWIINNLITKKIDDCSTETEDLKKDLNGQRASFESALKEYVRKELYDQAIELHRINSDDKFKSLLGIVTTQYTSLEAKINQNNLNVNEKIESLKEMIEKIPINKNGS